MGRELPLCGGWEQGRGPLEAAPQAFQTHAARAHMRPLESARYRCSAGGDGVYGGGGSWAECGGQVNLNGYTNGGRLELFALR